MSEPLTDATELAPRPATTGPPHAGEPPADRGERPRSKCGEEVLIALLVWLASIGLTVALASAYPSEAECRRRAPPPNCTFTDGHALGSAQHGLLGLWLSDRSACCDACERHGPPQQTEACVAAVFLNTSNASQAYSSESSLLLRQPNCLLYGAEAAGTAPVPLAAASLCRPPAARERTQARSWLAQKVIGQQSAQHWLHTELSELLGASAMLVRFGGLLFVSLMPTVLGGCCDYRGASLAQTLLRPRAAAKAARRAAN